MSDGLRLALGTLTVLPVRPPEVVDRRVGSWSMTFAPVVGALLAVVGAGFVALLDLAGSLPLLDAALTVGLLTALTRAIHLDGLADTADGLGSRQPAGPALEIMRKSDVGPFAVVALVLALLLQVGALAQLVAEGTAGLAVGVAVLSSRALLPYLCRRGVPPARSAGLGQQVAGSVSRGQLVLAAALTAAFAVVIFLGAYVLGSGRWSGELLAWSALAGFAALVAGGSFARLCVRRLGGVTGDVLGACVEVSFTTAVVAAALL